MDTLSGKQLRELKIMAHHLKPIVYVGKNGATDSLVAAVDRALADHELIKVKFIGFKDTKKTIVDTIVTGTRSSLVNIIGNIAIIFRQNKDADLRKIAI
jgi:RNA-binding protein